MIQWIIDNRNFIGEIYFFSSYAFSLLISFVIMYMKGKKNELDMSYRFGPGDELILFMLWLFSPLTFPFRFFRFVANSMESYHGRNTF